MERSLGLTREERHVLVEALRRAAGMSGVGLTDGAIKEARRQAVARDLFFDYQSERR